MKLVNFLNDLFKEDGFRLIDANKREYLIGKPKKKNPLILELLDSSMHYKLLLLPELYLGEGYMDGKIKIHNGTITEFLEIALKNLGKRHPNNLSKMINKILGTYKYLTNFNFAKLKLVKYLYVPNILFIILLKLFGCRFPRFFKAISKNSVIVPLCILILPSI